MSTLVDHIPIPFRYPPREVVAKGFELVDEELVRVEAEALAVERALTSDPVYPNDARATAQAASPVALTWGGITGGAVLAVGGSTVAAIAAGVAALVLVAVVVESSLRRTAA